VKKNLMSSLSGLQTTQTTVALQASRYGRFWFLGCSYVQQPATLRGQTHKVVAVSAHIAAPAGKPPDRLGEYGFHRQRLKSKLADQPTGIVSANSMACVIQGIEPFDVAWKTGQRWTVREHWSYYTL